MVQHIRYIDGIPKEIFVYKNNHMQRLKIYVGFLPYVYFCNESMIFYTWYFVIWLWVWWQELTNTDRNNCMPVLAILGSCMQIPTSY